MKKGGGKCEIEWYDKTLKDNYGNVLGLLAVGLDVTDRQAMEAQLHQTQKLESIRTLSAGLAHDFNNMLAVITGNTAYALSQLNQDNELFEVLLDAQKSANHAQALTHQLLTVPGGMGGVKTMAELLRIDPNVRAVVSSGHSNDPIMANYQDYGFCGVVPKPYTTDEIAELMNEVAGERNSLLHKSFSVALAACLAGTQN